MKHLSQKECIALMFELLNKKQQVYAENHIKSCDKCEKKFNSLLPIAVPYLKNNVIFPETLKKRILISVVKITNSEKKAKLIDIIQFFRKRAILYASVTASLIIIAAGTVFYFNVKTSTAYFKIARMYGKAQIDAIPAKLNDTVSSGNTISTNDNSAMMLLTLRDNKMMIMGESLLTINKAKLNRSNNLEVNYSLDKGILLNKNNQNASVKQAYTTPHALIRAQDADLMLQTSNDASSILLIKGKLEVVDKKSSNKITIDSPGEYIITNGDGMKMTKTEDVVIRDIQKLDEVFEMNEDENPATQNQNPDDSIKNSNLPDDAASVLREKLSRHIDQDADQ
ncbi:MAG: hypothetical protein V1874_00835 [Spirochaetota bacterium]